TKRTAWPAATSTAGSSVKLTRPAYGARSARPHADPAHTPAGSGAFGPHHEVHRDRDHQHAQYEHTPDRDARLCQLRDTKPGDQPENEEGGHDTRARTLADQSITSSHSAFTQFRNSSAPAAPDFSGWNC